MELIFLRVSICFWDARAVKDCFVESIGRKESAETAFRSTVAKDWNSFKVVNSLFLANLWRMRLIHIREGSGGLRWMH